jgi:hypothetical protein
VVHENTHGITNRMTGGGTGRCLQTTEAGGMGEGWSDAFAESVMTIVDYVQKAHRFIVYAVGRSRTAKPKTLRLVNTSQTIPVESAPIHIPRISKPISVMTFFDFTQDVNSRATNPLVYSSLSSLKEVHGT